MWDAGGSGLLLGQRMPKLRAMDGNRLMVAVAPAKGRSRVYTDERRYLGHAAVGSVRPMTDDPAVPVAPIGATAGGRAGLLSVGFTVAEVGMVRHEVRRHCAQAGLAGDDLDDFVLAVHELVTNAVRHGGGGGRLDLSREGDTITCEVRDGGGGTGMLRPHLPPGDIPGGRGLWLAQQLTAGLMIAAGSEGVSATVTVCLAPSPAVQIAGVEPAGPDPTAAAVEEGTS
jgi:serine/threonine-protein kinase RsbW